MSMYDIPLSSEQGRVIGEISIREEELPELRSWEVGQDYFIVVKVKQTGVSNNEEYPGEMDDNDRRKLTGRFKILAVRALDEKPVSLAQLEKEDMDRAYIKARGG